MFGVTPPDLSIYLDTPLENARKLMLLKSSRSYTDRQYDEHEADIALQRNVRLNYATIASMGLVSPWRVVHTVLGDGPPTPPGNCVGNRQSRPWAARCWPGGRQEASHHFPRVVEPLGMSERKLVDLFPPDRTLTA